MSNNWTMVNCIHNGSKTINWMKHILKTKSKQKVQSKATFLRKNTLVIHELTKTASFIAALMKKTYLTVHFTNG